MFYYIRRAGTEQSDGPYTDRDLLEMARAGTLQPDDLISSDRVDWHKARRYNLTFDTPTGDETADEPPSGGMAVLARVKDLATSAASAARNTVTGSLNSSTPPPIPRTAVQNNYYQGPPMPKRTSGLGVAALVLGIIACLFAWIPLLGMVAIPFALLGGLLGLIGLITAASDRQVSTVMPIVGGLLCGGAIGLQVLYVGAIAEAVNTPRRAGAPAVNAAPPDYIDKIELFNVETGTTVLDRPGVFGEIKNTGDRTVTYVRLTVEALDRQGRPVWDMTVAPVNRSSWDSDTRPPLKPNYGRKWGYRMDNLPSDYSGRVRVRVTDVELQ